MHRFDLVDRRTASSYPGHVIVVAGDDVRTTGELAIRGQPSSNLPCSATQLYLPSAVIVAAAARSLSMSASTCITLPARSSASFEWRTAFA